VGVELYADRQKDGHDETNFANAPKKSVENLQIWLELNKNIEVFI
jgi:hypothetical protein